MLECNVLTMKYPPVEQVGIVWVNKESILTARHKTRKQADFIVSGGCRKTSREYLKVVG